MQLTQLTAWTSLDNHAELLRTSLEKQYKLSSNKSFQLKTTTIHLDFSHQKINQDSLQLLLNLARECNLSEKIAALYRGDITNRSENKPALHTALRCYDDERIYVNGKNIIPDIVATREKMRLISTKIRAGDWLGFSGKMITNIVNIGIGGSDLGPRFCVDALTEYHANHLTYHFVSDADPMSFNNAVATLNPETTLFIISSKTFTTPETLYNAEKAFAWIGNSPGRHNHFIAVTANIEHANNFGINTVLPIWAWVGGRYSLCSAINLITCIAIGYDKFTELLAGAHSMDKHFQTNQLHENMPVIMALTGIWNINFLHIPSLLMLVYAKQLEKIVPYIQQLDMESNGKSVDMNGRAVNYETGPIVWGGLGNQAQHSYYQLLCQGTHKIATDFISTQTFSDELVNSFCEKKIQVLSKGTSPTTDLQRFIRGGMPINHLSLTSCSPFCLGSLVALYEHKIYTQSVIWNINPFDQAGVESIKELKTLSLI